MDILSTALFTFYVTLAVIAFTLALGYFAYRGVKAHLKEARLGRGCVLISDTELMGK